jgi:hypothetical protein
LPAFSSQLRRLPYYRPLLHAAAFGPPVVGTLRRKGSSGPTRMRLWVYYKILTIRVCVSGK